MFIVTTVIQNDISMAVIVVNLKVVKIVTVTGISSVERDPKFQLGATLRASL